MFDVRIVSCAVLFERRNRGGKVGVLFQEELFVGCFESADIAFVEVTAAQPDLIDATYLGIMAFSDGVGCDVLRDAGHAADDGMTADTGELMDGYEAGDNGVVLDDYVACNGGAV